MQVPIQPLAGLSPLPPPSVTGRVSRPAVPSADTGELPDWSSLLDSKMAEPALTTAPPATALNPAKALPKTILGKQEAVLDPRELHKLDQTAHDLESVFLRTILKQLTGSLAFGGGALGKSSTAEFYNGFAWEQMADGMAGGEHGGVGLGQMIYAVLVRDEAAKHQNPKRHADVIIEPTRSLPAATPGL
ncbi:MAG: hypothetical protein ABI743_01940 [bacterium]